MKLVTHSGAIYDDPWFNNFYNEYVDKFVRITNKRDKPSSKCYYVNDMHYYKDGFIELHSDGFNINNFNGTDDVSEAHCKLDNNTVNFNVNDINEGSIHIDIISKDEYLCEFDKWIDQVRKSMTDFS